MPKPGIHPKWYPDAKVYCNGELIMTVGSTKERIDVDVWSGNHPFYTGTQKIIDTEGRVERFMRKYGMMPTENTPTTITGAAAPAEKPQAQGQTPKSPKKKK